MKYPRIIEIIELFELKGVLEYQLPIPLMGPGTELVSVEVHKLTWSQSQDEKRGRYWVRPGTRSGNTVSAAGVAGPAHAASTPRPATLVLCALSAAHRGFGFGTVALSFLKTPLSFEA